MNDANVSLVRVWEWPLRVWHWLFAATVAGSLITGLSGDIGWMDWHLRFGFVAAGLLLFRLFWGFLGGPYSRWRTYWTTPGRVIGYFRRAADHAQPTPAAAHTPPGVLLIWLFMLAVLTQTVTGLFTTDDIFIEGPMVRHASGDLVSTMGWLHHRVYYLVLFAIGMHLLAHLYYGVRRDPLPLSMLTGKKRLPAALADVQGLGLKGIVLGAISAALVWTALTLV
jgi:cytochrome b